MIGVSPSFLFPSFSFPFSFPPSCPLLPKLLLRPICFIGFLLLSFIPSLPPAACHLPSFCSHPLSLPFASFPWSFPLLLLTSPGHAHLDDPAGRRGGVSTRCRVDACSMVPLEGEAPLPPPRSGSGPERSTTQLPSRPLKVICRPPAGAKKASLDSLCLGQLPFNTRVLEISNLSLDHLAKGSFAHLQHLRKLDLHGNGIKEIETGAFEGLANLKRLDLSGNSLTSVDGRQLIGLKSLVRLKLGHNPLKHLREDILQQLPSLRAIELVETELECDCHLKWLLELPAAEDAPNGGSSSILRRSFGRRKPIRLLGSPVCAAPPLLRRTKLKKLSSRRMLCQDQPSKVTVVEIEPLLDQVVFAGDSLRLQCKVSGRDKHLGKVWWKWGQKHLLRGNASESRPDGSSHSRATEGDADPSRLAAPHGDEEFQYEDIIVKRSLDNGSMVSFVEIPQVSWGHSGEWSCMVEGDHNTTRSISIYVIHHDTKYCPANVTHGNKGIYSWPRTVALVTVDLPCQGVASFRPHPWGASPPGQTLPSAEHSCGRDGRWHSLDTSRCPYISETTRILEHFARTNLSATTTTLQESVKTLRNFTRTALFKGPDDVSLLAKTVEQYAGLLADSAADRHSAIVLADIIGSTSSLAKGLLRSAELMDKSCTRLVGSLWTIADKAPSLDGISGTHLHLLQVRVQPENFSGVSCLWFRKSRHSTDREFKCNFSNYTAMIEEEVLDARIRIAPPLMLETNDSADLSSGTNETSEKEASRPTRLHFFVYDSANLFPTIRENSWKITSPVIGLKVTGAEFSGPLSVYVTLRSAIYSHNILPAWWKEGGARAHSNWTSDGCKVVRVLNSLVTFRCSKAGHFGLLQDMASLYGHRGEKGAPFRLCSPGVYVGSTICCLFLMASIATWSIHHQHIHTMAKNKHSFVNTWVAILFLVALFTVGIYQTETPVMCQVVGVVLHYLTTCVLLWIVVSVTNLYKKVTKTLRPPPVALDDAPSDGTALPPKPMLRFYLVGWGISLILCGISAAVNLRHYNTYNYCFLAWNQSLAAFYAPSAALVFILVTFFVITQCVLKSSHGGYSEATGNTETTELELLDAVSPNSENPPSGPAEDELSVASQTSSLSLLDGQHSPTTQLRAHVVTLLLFVLTWASAAITTASPFSSIIPYHTTIFSIVYAICSSSLGIFIFVFFCLSRSDVLEVWKELLSLCSPPAKEDETHLTVANNVTVHSSNESSVPNSSINNQIGPSASPVLAPSVRSVDSANTHPTNKSSSLSQSMHASNKQESTGKASNALHILNLSSFADNIQYAPESFYNPKQVGVAKRFFQKQRLKQMMKQNNLEMNRPDSDCNSSTVYCPRTTTRVVNSESDVSSFDPSCLGILNKVNNTNIHVDGAFVSKQSSKTLTPELLCILGPPKNTCKIVNSSENDQHQWPVTFHFQCSPNSQRSQPKNKSPIPSSDFPTYPIYPFLAKSEELNSSSIVNHKYERKSPLLGQEMNAYPPKEAGPQLQSKSQGKEGRKEREPYPRRPQLSRGGGKAHRQNRPKRKRSRSRGSEKDDLKHWSEEESSNVLGNNILASSLPLSAAAKTPSPNFKPSKKEGLKQTSSPVGAMHHHSPPTASLGSHGKEFLSSSPIAPALPVSSVEDYPQPCTEMEWLHLLQKRSCNDPYTTGGGNDFFCCDKDPHHYPPSCYSDGDSTEGGAECDVWDNDLEINDWAEIRPSIHAGEGVESFDMMRGHRGLCGSNDFGGRSSDCDTSSIATSLIPGVDTSPPASLPVSDSPFDSPLHKFHQNTPDSLSLDSGSLLSPLKSHFSSCDNPNYLNDSSPVGGAVNPLPNSSQCDTPTLTLTISTPVNTPLAPFTPTDTPISLTHSASSKEMDLNILESPDKETPTDLPQEKGNLNISPTRNEDPIVGDSSDDKGFATEEHSPEGASPHSSSRAGATLRGDGKDETPRGNGEEEGERETRRNQDKTSHSHHGDPSTSQVEESESSSGNTTEQESTSSSRETDV